MLLSLLLLLFLLLSTCFVFWLASCMWAGGSVCVCECMCLHVSEGVCVCGCRVLVFACVCVRVCVGVSDGQETIIVIATMMCITKGPLQSFECLVFLVHVANSLQNRPLRQSLTRCHQEVSQRSWDLLRWKDRHSRYKIHALMDFAEFLKLSGYPGLHPATCSRVGGVASAYVATFRCNGCDSSSCMQR